MGARDGTDNGHSSNLDPLSHRRVRATKPCERRQRMDRARTAVVDRCDPSVRLVAARLLLPLSPPRARNVHAVGAHTRGDSHALCAGQIAPGLARFAALRSLGADRAGCDERHEDDPPRGGSTAPAAAATLLAHPRALPRGLRLAATPTSSLEWPGAPRGGYVPLGLRLPCVCMLLAL